jgi:hypothetical protein
MQPFDTMTVDYDGEPIEPQKCGFGWPNHKAVAGGKVGTLADIYSNLGNEKLVLHCC